MIGPARPLEVAMLTLYQARLVRPPQPATQPLMVSFHYDSVWATWSRTINYPPMHTRVPLDDRLGLALLEGERVPCPHTNQLPRDTRSPLHPGLGFAVGSGIRAVRQVGGFHGEFRVWPDYNDAGDPAGSLVRCDTCAYRGYVGGPPNFLRAQDPAELRHPTGRTIIRAPVACAPLPTATTSFDFDHGRLVAGTDAVDLVYGTPRSRLSNRYLDTHLGPAARTYHSLDGVLYVARARTASIQPGA
jgi:hypothetical protein